MPLRMPEAFKGVTLNGRTAPPHPPQARGRIAEVVLLDSASATTPAVHLEGGEALPALVEISGDGGDPAELILIARCALALGDWVKGPAVLGPIFAGRLLEAKEFFRTFVAYRHRPGVGLLDLLHRLDEEGHSNEPPFPLDVALYVAHAIAEVKPWGHRFGPSVSQTHLGWDGRIWRALRVPARPDFLFATPESVAGQPENEPSVAYRLATLLSWLLGRQHPLRRHDNLYNRVLSIVQHDIVPLESLRQDLPRACLDAIEASLATEAKDRPTVASLFDACGQFASPPEAERYLSGLLERTFQPERRADQLFWEEAAKVPAECEAMPFEPLEPIEDLEGTLSEIDDRMSNRTD